MEWERNGGCEKLTRRNRGEICFSINSVDVYVVGELVWRDGATVRRYRGNELAHHLSHNSELRKMSVSTSLRQHRTAAHPRVSVITSNISPPRGREWRWVRRKGCLVDINSEERFNIINRDSEMCLHKKFSLCIVLEAGHELLTEHSEGFLLSITLRAG